MTFAVRAKRTSAALLALAVVVTGLTLSPLSAAPAEAATNSSNASSVLKSLNSYRASKSVAKLKPNAYVKKYAQEFAALVAKKGSIYGDPGTPKTALPAGYNTDTDVYVASYVYSSTATEAAKIKKIVAGYKGYKSGSPSTTVVLRSNLNYGSVGLVKKGNYIYATLVLLEYASAPNDQMIAGTPKIVGTPKVGGKLSASVTFKPAASTYSYQWKVNGSNVGSNAKTYYPTTADKGKKVTVTVTGTRSGYNTPAAKTSAKSKTVAAGTLKAVATKISGTRYLGNTLTANPGSWKPEGVKFTYQWLREGKAISKATSASYRLVARDKGKKIDVKVTGKLANYATHSTTTKTKYKVKP